MIYDVIVKPMADNKYQLVESFYYGTLEVPKGYETNGISIPRIFWVVIPPFKPKYLPAVIVHDYLCDLEQYKLADAYFKEMLLGIEKSIVTKSMVLAVEVYHKIKYRV